MTAPTTATIRVTLPDGSVREVPSGTTSRQVAESIGPGLARAALAARVNGSDLGPRPSARGRHDAGHPDGEATPTPSRCSATRSAHILATAVRELFPNAGIGFGPPIEDGFYYDFQVDRPFTPEDLERIEAQDGRGDGPRLSVRARGGGPRRGQPALRRRPAQARAHHASWATTRPSRSTPTARSRISAAARTSRAPAGSSTSSCCTAAGAYWRGDERRQMLQRIYGTAWFKKEDLDAYLHRLEEARKRDHRRVGRELDLFMFHPSAPGAAVLDRARHHALQPAGGLRARAPGAGPSSEIKTPLLYNKMLWETSGHWGKYRENMFLVLNKETGEHDSSLKPMNCPSHYLLYRRPRSTRTASCRSAT